MPDDHTFKTTGTMIESVYYVISWLCHRQCVHCYEDRFRPYQGTELSAALGEAQASFETIIDHFPEHMRYKDPETPALNGGASEKIGRIILSGGEVLLPKVRDLVLYPAIERITQKYKDKGGVKVVVQTTGDLVTARIIDELLRRGVWMISVSGMDDFHEGMNEEYRHQLTSKLAAQFENAGMQRSGLQSAERKWHDESGPVYSFFGATPDSWIGKIWPRGRAWKNDLSKATLSDNFCNAWSGGLNFLNLGLAGSEVSVEPNGNVYPCCLKTGHPLGNLVEEPLVDILLSLVGHPACEAISMGHPERMGISSGWSPAQFMDRSRTTTNSGRPYQNLCIGCDRFHEEVLGPQLSVLRQKRLAKKSAAPSTP